MANLTPRQKSRLQKLINKATAASNAYNDAMSRLSEFELKHWNFEHADRDIDSIIDGCCGGCGHSYGMSADEFIKLMNEAE